jgi:hypothetical protein
VQGEALPAKRSKVYRDIQAGVQLEKTYALEADRNALSMVLLPVRASKD